ncbi:MAG: non-hydrolyzing UDP-N-acetylglucosamine 2-epimerase [Solirubrobacterales bacterium]
MTKQRVSVLIVVGTRPEAIKLVPMILALEESEVFRPLVVSTGQHHRMVEEVFALAGIKPDYELWVGGARNQLNDRVREVMGRLDDFCREEFGADGATGHGPGVIAGDYPMAVLVHGDTSSAFAAALASFHLRIPVVHVEAGLRTGSNLTPFPEELNRQMITCIASFNLAPTWHNLQNLVREDVPIDQVFVTGNTGIDALRWAAGLEVEITDPAVREIYHSARRMIVITAHRRENWGPGLDGIAEGVKALAIGNPDDVFVVPMHPNPDVRAQWEPLREVPNICLTEPATYAEFAKILTRCFLVITDSGGIQEEAPSLGKPVLVARETTERGEGVEAGTLKLVGTDPKVIYDETMNLLNDEAAYQAMSSAENPYGDGHASSRIVAALENLYLGGPAPSAFSASFSRTAVIAAAGYQRGVFDQPKLDPRTMSESERGEGEAHRHAGWPDFGTVTEADTRA